MRRVLWALLVLLSLPRHAWPDYPANSSTRRQNGGGDDECQRDSAPASDAVPVGHYPVDGHLVRDGDVVWVSGLHDLCADHRD